jgi:thiamine pyrophosphokinase
MKDCVLFLNGQYPRKHLDYYRSFCRDAFAVAVDGGYRFFKAAGLWPDLLIGDFDSISRVPRNLPETTKVVEFSSHKDKTDAHLALEHCLKLKPSRIRIVQPSTGEPDQFIGNMMLLTLARNKQSSKRRPDIRIINIAYEILFLDNSTHTITHGSGGLVSIIPLSRTIRYTCTGTEYLVRDRKLRRGDSLALRNSITGKRAGFRVKGQAFLVHRFADHK